MKKILFSALLALCALPAFANQEFKYNVGAKARFHLASPTDGTGIAGATITNITLKLLKDNSSTATALTCVASSPTGAQRVCTEVTNSSGDYTVTFLNGDVDTVGNVTLTALYSTSITTVTDISVLSAAFYDSKYAGDIADSAQIADDVRIEMDGSSTIASNVAAALADVLRQYLFKAGVDKPLLIGPFKNSSGTFITSGTPSCTIRSNSSTTYAAVVNTPSAVDSHGMSLLTIDDTESNGKTALNLYCTLSGATAFTVSIIPQ